MANNYKTLSTNYYNTGGHCMVTTMAVYDLVENKQLFVYVSDDALTVNTVDFLQFDIEWSEDWQLYSIDCAEWSTDPDPLNRAMNSLPLEISMLLSSCLHQHIKNKVKETKQPYRCNWRQLPFQLATAVDDSYARWLDEQNMLISTDGETIQFEEEYTKLLGGFAADDDDENLIVANRLKDDLYDWMPKDDADEKEWDKFYRINIQLIINDRLYTFYNEAIVYQALEDLARTIIDDKK